MLCALTHHILGASNDDIFEDYELTNSAAGVDTRLPEAQTYFNNLLGKSYDAEVYRPFLGVDPDFLRAALKSIEAEAGSVDIYLVDVLGVDDAKQSAIRARLLD